MAEQPNRHDPHLVVYALWPVVAGLLMGLVLALSVGGVALLWTRLDWRAAGVWAAGTFFVVLGVVTVGVFLYATADWTGPRRQERIERSRREVVHIHDQAPPRFIPLSSGRPLQREPPTLPASPEERGAVAKAIDLLSDRLKARAAVTTYEQDAETLEPDAPPWVREMYAVVCASWPDHLTRRDWQRLFPDGGTALWSRYVNGTGDRRGQRGVLATWGAIERADGRGAWQYTQPLDVVFSLDPELQRYAEARSGLVKRSPGRAGVTGNAARGHAEPNQTNDQTKRQKGR